MIRGITVGIFLLTSAPLAVGAEPHPKVCLVLEALAGPASCHLTECRRVGYSKVQLGPEKEGVERLQTEGDLTLLDHQCGRETPLAALIGKQARELEERGFSIQAGGIESSEIVLRKNNHWIELSGVVLEGVPTISVRSLESASTQGGRQASTGAGPAAEPPAAPRSARGGSPSAPAPVAVVEAPAASAPAAKPISRMARASGPAPVLPAGMDSVSGPAARVEVEVLIDERGQLQKVLSARGSPQLIGPAMQSLREWKFEAAMEVGVARPAVLTLTLDFRARGN